MAASPEQLRTAVDEYRRLFRPQQLNQLHACRRLALDAMCDLAAFEPQLAGSLVHGDGPLDRIRLLLRADTPEQVIMHLDDRHIPWRTAEARCCTPVNGASIGPHCDSWRATRVSSW